MKIVLMQPYFFPYIGYFTLIRHSDVFVVFDTAQYIRRGWVHRNRIVGSNGEPIYINASVVKAPQNTPIHQIELSSTLNWKQEILNKIKVYKNITPHYPEVYPLIEDSINHPASSLSDLNLHALTRICDYLEVPYNFVRLSELEIDFNDVRHPDDWGLKVSQYYKADTYINAPGGQEFYSKEKYRKNDIEMLFYKTKLAAYDQKLPVFHPALSIIDVMMFNTKKEIRQMIDDFEVL